MVHIQPVVQALGVSLQNASDEAVMTAAVHATLLAHGYTPAAVGEASAFNTAKRVQEGKAVLPLNAIDDQPSNHLSASEHSSRTSACYGCGTSGALLVRIACAEGSCLLDAAFVPPNGDASSTASTSFALSSRVHPKSSTDGASTLLSRLIEPNKLAADIQSSILTPLQHAPTEEEPSSSDAGGRSTHASADAHHQSTSSPPRSHGSGPVPAMPHVVQPVGIGTLDPSSFMQPQGMHFGPNHPFFRSERHVPSREGWLGRPPGSRYDPPGVPDPLMEDSQMYQQPRPGPEQLGQIHPDLAPLGFDDRVM